MTIPLVSRKSYWERISFNNPEANDSYCFVMYARLQNLSGWRWDQDRHTIALSWERSNNLFPNTATNLWHDGESRAYNYSTTTTAIGSPFKFSLDWFYSFGYWRGLVVTWTGAGYWRSHIQCRQCTCFQFTNLNLAAICIYIQNSTTSCSI